MAKGKGLIWPAEALQKKGFIQVNGGDFVKASTQVATGKVEKIVPGKRTIPGANKKIKGATKIFQDGIKFDSRLELFLYNLLRASGISFEFQRRIVLQEGFMFGTETIRPVTIIVDFWLRQRSMIIDSKGFQLEDNKIKFKLLKKHLVDNYPNRHIKIEMPRNQTDCRDLVNRLLYDPL